MVAVNKTIVSRVIKDNRTASLDACIWKMGSLRTTTGRH